MKTYLKINKNILKGNKYKSDIYSRDEVQTKKQNSDKQSKTKLIVKNVPFSAKKKEVEEIFR